MISLEKGIEYLKWALSYVKGIFVYYFLRKTVKQEISHDQLQTQNKVHQEQLDKAAAPPRPWGDVLKRMREGKR